MASSSEAINLRAQILELQTKVDILQSDKKSLEHEKDQLLLDLEEAEKNLVNLAKELKD